MRFIRDIYKEKAAIGKPVVSFELFPPKTEKGEKILMEKTLPALMEMKPDYCSVTYGAGGSTRDTTLRVVDQIQKDFDLPALAHLTCVCSTKEDIRKFLEEARDIGIKNILALRGDPPGGKGQFVKTEGGFEYSYELVEFIREFGGFSIGVAGFPEGHIACNEGRQVDWDRLAKKIHSGADFVITQLFFDNQDFYSFTEYLRTKHNVEVPIIPGIIPIVSGPGIRKFTSMCGASIPERLSGKLDQLGEDLEATALFGVDYATEQCRDLLEKNTPGIHLYSLNKAKAALTITNNLGL
ncbi:methylenetetrahydrofolate reductase [NAD(P)H] [Verrucomicrobia bacterium]|nr:methylenetetrahydrofolate reductase [NAD(P)H] [Verrucomicrobiota bacterium]